MTPANGLGDQVQLAPGAVLCGEVTVGARSHVGAGALVIQTVSIGTRCLIAAGATVTIDVANSQIFGSAPARSLAP